MKTHLLTIILCASHIIGSAQTLKKELTHDNLIHWNRITNVQLTPDGNWIMYELNQEKGDNRLLVKHNTTQQEILISRGAKAQFSADSKYLFAMVQHPEDSINHWKRSDIPKDDMPKDTLLILELGNQQVQKIGNVLSFKVPEKSSAFVAYHLGPVKDTTFQKKENKKNGSRLLILDLIKQTLDTILYVKAFEVAEEETVVAFETSGDSGVIDEGVYRYINREIQPAHTNASSYKKIQLSKSGDKLAFLVHDDTSKPKIPPYQLMLSSNGNEADLIAAPGNGQIPNDWIINAYETPSFSDDESKMIFGVSPKPVLQDTSLLDDEIVDVEVWNWKDGQLYTQQENRLKQIKEKAYAMAYDLGAQKITPLGSLDWPNIRMTDSKQSAHVLALNPNPYWHLRSWESSPDRVDAAVVDISTGTLTEIGKNIKGNLRISPEGRYVYWWSSVDTSWNIYNIASKTQISISSTADYMFEDKRNDRPMLPYPYGYAGWTNDDSEFWVYGKYDIWSLDPEGTNNPVRLTDGHLNNHRWRWYDLDPETPSIDITKDQYLSVFNMIDKQAGIAVLNTNKELQVVQGLSPHRYRYLKKAVDANVFSFQRENFREFGNIWTTSDWNTVNQMSDANPQQSEYKWGNAELYDWTDLHGNTLQGLLVKPDDFDPSKKYPLLVNFYERSTDGLHGHRAPYPGRSTINYPFYVSKGYVIFNPDVPYRIGYPGESALNSVISGVTALINEGFIDKEKVGVQGHSWGGYQVAHLLTKTDIFTCAEAGAPVVNMFSAYGGIRWGSGMSRMFQYEQTQSRIGGTIWEYPIRYLENSPLFFLDKVNTPVLIMHNDEDGAVPWYQGIEYFVGLRRLGKPCWLLNYNGEPHWPVKLENRIDFNVRMQQFFDHYLMDAPMPVWMDKGVPAVEKGILQGLELTKE